MTEFRFGPKVVIDKRLKEENCRTISWGYSLNYIKKRIAEGYSSCYPHRYYFNEDYTKFRMTHEYYWWARKR